MATSSRGHIESQVLNSPSYSNVCNAHASGGSVRIAENARPMWYVGRETDAVGDATIAYHTIAYHTIAPMG
eukprot:COSAG02_NODE_18587_length_930_cov_4.767750_1_plen_71_part_00